MRILFYLGIGGVWSVALSWILPFCLNLADGTSQSASGMVQGRTWSVTVTDRIGGMCWSPIARRV